MYCRDDRGKERLAPTSADGIRVLTLPTALFSTRRGGTAGRTCTTEVEPPPELARARKPAVVYGCRVYCCRVVIVAAAYGLSSKQLNTSPMSYNPPNASMWETALGVAALVDVLRLRVPKQELTLYSVPFSALGRFEVCVVRYLLAYWHS